MTGVLTTVLSGVHPVNVLHLPHAPTSDDSPRPKILHHSRRHAPKKAPCPHCGRPGRRKDFHQRTVRSLAYKAILLVHITTAEYRANCDCCATFRTQIEGIEPKARYSNAVREAVLDRLLEDPAMRWRRLPPLDPGPLLRH